MSENWKGMLLKFPRVIKVEHDVKASHDHRFKVDRKTVEYTGEDGHKYRKSFECGRGCELNIPEYGTHEELKSWTYQPYGFETSVK